jgi:Zn-dependent protease
VDQPPEIVIASLLVLFVGIGLHEFAHCYFADLAGDPTPRYYGRVTLNLFKHFEPIGALLIVITSLTGFGIGWGRPAPINPSKMRNPRWDTFIAVIAGPLSNLAQAVIYAAFLRILPHLGPQVALSLIGDSKPSFLYWVLVLGVIENLGLMLFNLIPFGPLDGHWLLGLLLPEPARTRWFQFNRQVGIFGVFILVMVLNRAHISLTAGPLAYMFRLLTGIEFP